MPRSELIFLALPSREYTHLQFVHGQATYPRLDGLLIFTITFESVIIQILEARVRYVTFGSVITVFFGSQQQ